MIKRFPEGMTVTELKQIIQKWPETDENGEPTEVYIESGIGLSSPVFELSTLNLSGDSADMLLKYRVKTNG